MGSGTSITTQSLVKNGQAGRTLQTLESRRAIRDGRIVVVQSIHSTQVRCALDLRPHLHLENQLPRIRSQSDSKAASSIFSSLPSFIPRWPRPIDSHDPLRRSNKHPSAISSFDLILILSVLPPGDAPSRPVSCSSKTLTNVDRFNNLLHKNLLR